MIAENVEVSYGPGRGGVSGLRRRLFVFNVHRGLTTTGGKVAAPPWDTPKCWGLDGYDLVAYVTDQKPKLGDPKYAYEARGVRWKFASLEHQQMFIADPSRYEPQFGGYCAYAVSLNTTSSMSMRTLSRRIFGAWTGPETSTRATRIGPTS